MLLPASSPQLWHHNNIASLKNEVSNIAGSSYEIAIACWNADFANLPILNLHVTNNCHFVLRRIDGEPTRYSDRLQHGCMRFELKLPGPRYFSKDIDIITVDLFHTDRHNRIVLV